MSTSWQLAHHLRSCIQIAVQDGKKICRVAKSMLLQYELRASGLDSANPQKKNICYVMIGKSSACNVCKLAPSSSMFLQQQISRVFFSVNVYIDLWIGLKFEINLSRN